MIEKKYVVVGEVSKPHGVKGELCILCYANSPSLFGAVKSVRLVPPAGAAPGRSLLGKHPARTAVAVYKTLAFRPHQNRALLTLEGVADRDQAEALRGRLVEVDADLLKKDSPDEIFIHELLGCRVRESGAPEDAPDLGSLEDVQDEAGQELWVIARPDGGEILLPAVPEFVEDIDLDAGLIVICPPPGLLELYAEKADQE